MRLFHFLLIAVTVSCSVAFSSTRSRFSKKYVTGMSDLMIFNSTCCFLAAALLTVAAYIAKDTLNAFTFGYGTAYGLLIAVASISALKAFQTGPLSYTTVITSFAMVFPSVAGVLFWNESIKPIKHIGMALILVSIFFAINLKKKDEKKASLIWLMFCFLTLFLNGTNSVMQKWFKMRENSGGTFSFLAVSFFVSAIITLSAFFYLRRTPKEKEKRANSLVRSDMFKRVIIIFSLICGVTTVVSNVLTLYLAGAMDSAVLFPVLNGGGLYTVTIVSVVFFKERLSARQWVGLVTGFAAIMILAVS